MSALLLQMLSDQQRINVQAVGCRRLACILCCRRRTFRKFTYRGVDLEQLLDLGTEELIQLLPARARRRIGRGLKRKPLALIKKLREAKKSAAAGEWPDLTGAAKPPSRKVGGGVAASAWTVRAAVQTHLQACADMRRHLGHLPAWVSRLWSAQSMCGSWSAAMALPMGRCCCVQSSGRESRFPYDAVCQRLSANMCIGLTTTAAGTRLKLDTNPQCCQQECHIATFSFATHKEATALCGRRGLDSKTGYRMLYCWQRTCDVALCCNFAGEKPEPVRTHLRNMLIMPEMIGSVVGVYNGKTFNQVCTPCCHAL